MISSASYMAGLARRRGDNRLHAGSDWTSSRARVVHSLRGQAPRPPPDATGSRKSKYHTMPAPAYPRNTDNPAAAFPHTFRSTVGIIHRAFVYSSKSRRDAGSGVGTPSYRNT